MKKGFVYFIYYLFLLCFLLGQQTWGKQKLHFTGMSNNSMMEITFRAFHKDRAIKNLKKEDIELFVNGQPLRRLDLSHFCRKLGNGSTHPRTIILIFQITDLKNSFRQSFIDIFEKILHTHDRVIVIANHKNMIYPQLKKKVLIQTQIEKELNEQAVLKSKRLVKACYGFENQMQFVYSTPYISYLFQRYIPLWKNCKETCLMPDFAWCSQLESLLKDPIGEIWIFHFYQLQQFPRIGFPDRLWDRIRASQMNAASNEALYSAFGRVDRNLIKQFEEELQLKEISLEKIRSLFYQLNVTYNCFFITSKESKLKKDYNYKKVVRNLTTFLKNLSQTSGGIFYHSRQSFKILPLVQNNKDYYFKLRFMPTGFNAPLKIQLKLKKRKYKVYYHGRLN